MFVWESSVVFVHMSDASKILDKILDEMNEKDYITIARVRALTDDHFENPREKKHGWYNTPSNRAGMQLVKWGYGYRLVFPPATFLDIS